jgi:Raf kinase inhibitor-like YbhB/YbcL family protein
MKLCRVSFLAGGSFFLVGTSALSIVSIGGLESSFQQGGQIPFKYARTHENVSPPLFFTWAVSGDNRIKSFALIVDDPDAPSGLFTHWLVWNIPLDHPDLPEGGVPPGAVQGTNSFGDTHYDGPAPPNGKHRYFFHLYGLDTLLSLPAGSDRDALEAAMKGHIVAKATDFYGTFATGQ